MRMVVKIGTNLLTAADGSLNQERIESLVDAIVQIKTGDDEVVIVTSGAIGAGMGKLKIESRPKSLKEKQALAAIGQPLLMDIYQTAFSEKGITIAQVLLTRHDFIDRQRYLNARNTLVRLLEWDVVPIINENDTIAVEEIDLKFGDNDTLSALVAAKVSADLLVIFTDVDGLYKGIPGASELVTKVDKITKEIEDYASGDSSSGKGVGGMRTKIAAAKIATAAGVNVVIANGQNPGVLVDIAAGRQTGTTFSCHEPLEARKCWIAFGAKCAGKIVVDDGAAKAVKEADKSLLPSGIVKVEGKFGVGDSVSIVTRSGVEIARGLTEFTSADIEVIKGKKTSEVKKLLDDVDSEEVIHKDNLVVTV